MCQGTDPLESRIDDRLANWDGGDLPPRRAANAIAWRELAVREFIERMGIKS